MDLWGVFKVLVYGLQFAACGTCHHVLYRGGGGGGGGGGARVVGSTPSVPPRCVLAITLWRSSCVDVLSVAKQTSITDTLWTMYHTSALSSYMTNWCIDRVLRTVRIFNIDSFCRATFARLWIYVANASDSMEGSSEDLSVKLHHLSETQVHMYKSALFMRSLLHLRKEHSNSWVPICSKAALQTRQKSILNLGINFVNM